MSWLIPGMTGPGLLLGAAAGSSSDPADHPNAVHVWDFQNLASLTTTPSGSPGTVTEEITDVVDQVGSKDLLGGGTGQYPFLEQDADGAYYAENLSQDFFVNTAGPINFQTIIIGAYITTVSATFAGLVTDDAGLAANEIHGAFRTEDNPPTKFSTVTTAGADMGDGTRIWTDGTQTNSITTSTKTCWIRDTTTNTNLDQLTNGIQLFRREASPARFVRGRIYYVALIDAILTSQEISDYNTFVRETKMLL